MCKHSAMKEVICLTIKKDFFNHLDERRKRQYAATEALSLGYGGQSAVHRAFGISIATIRKGISELKWKSEVPKERIRKKGGGRKKNS